LEMMKPLVRIAKERNKPRLSLWKEQSKSHYVTKHTSNQPIQDPSQVDSPDQTTQWDESAYEEAAQNPGLWRPDSEGAGNAASQRNHSDSKSNLPGDRQVTFEALNAPRAGLTISPAYVIMSILFNAKIATKQTYSWW
jgi:hypothetical protein